MSLLSFPDNPRQVLVLDASVVINLNATGYAPQIIDALPGEFRVTDNVASELKNGAEKGHNDAEQLTALIRDGFVSAATMGEAALQTYALLIEGSALLTLDDGEASTIAYAGEIGAIAVIDERKARSLCAKVLRSLRTVTSVDLLLHESVQNSLGKESQVEAVYNALKYARMRVPVEYIARVVDVIGKESAASCESLPLAIRRSVAK